PLAWSLPASRLRLSWDQMGAAGNSSLNSATVMPCLSPKWRLVIALKYFAQSGQRTVPFGSAGRGRLSRGMGPPGPILLPAESHGVELRHLMGRQRSSALFHSLACNPD